jgi:ketosteroid isomerase-like protein
MANGPAEETGYYLRIWRKNERGEWKLALDLLHFR